MKKNNSTIKIFSIWMASALLLLMPRLVFPQVTVVKGIVTDQNDKPLKNAKITFHDPTRGLKFNVKSNEEGEFIKAGMPPALYNVTVGCEGYFTFESPVRISFGMEEKILLKLRKIPPRIDEDKNLSKGIDSFEHGNYDKAIGLFKKVIEEFPSNVEGYYNLGLTYLRKGDIDKATASLEKAVEIKPDGVETYLALGECYFNKGETEKAMNSFSQATEVQPENPKAWYNLGVVYYKLDKTEQALEAFDKSIKLNPDFSSAHYQAGLASIKKGDYQEAIEYFEGFLRLEPDAPEANQVKAMMEELKKRLNKNE